MMKFFKRGARAVRVPHPGIIRVRQYIEYKQRGWAKAIEHRLQRLSARALAMYLMGFCIVTSSFCAYLLIMAIAPTGTTATRPAGHTSQPTINTMDTVFVYPDSLQ